MIRIISLFSVLMVAATFSAACDESFAGPSPNPTSAAQVTDGVWTLQSFQRADSTLVSVPNPDRFTIEISADGRVAVRADCNRCSASYSQASDGLLVNPLMACTKAFCSTAPFDTEYAAALSDAKLVRTGNNTLQSVSKNGVLTFTR